MKVELWGLTIHKGNQMPERGAINFLQLNHLACIVLGAWLQSASQACQHDCGKDRNRHQTSCEVCKDSAQQQHATLHLKHGLEQGRLCYQDDLVSMQLGAFSFQDHIACRLVVQERREGSLQRCVQLQAPQSILFLCILLHDTIVFNTSPPSKHCSTDKPLEAP